jgi:hypothetical protein
MPRETRVAQRTNIASSTPDPRNLVFMRTGSRDLLRCYANSRRGALATHRLAGVIIDPIPIPLTVGSTSTPCAAICGR